MGKLLCEREVDFFDIFVVEQIELAGEEVNFYGQDLVKTKIHPLFGEPTQRVIGGPTRMYALVKWPASTIDAGEHGFGVEFDSMVTIARKTFEDKHSEFPYPGDIIEMWRTPYHDAASLGSGLFFDVIKVDTKGHVHDSALFTKFEMTLKRRTQYGAERKITPP